MKRLFLLVIGVTVTLSLTALSWAGLTLYNDDGAKDGKYRVQLEDNRTKERTEVFDAHVEGNFLIVHYPDGDVTYRINEWYDRRTELELSIYDTKNSRYVTAHLDDGTHIFHKETQEYKAKQKAEKARKRKEKILARKKKHSSQTPAPSSSPVPDLAPNATDGPEA